MRRKDREVTDLSELNKIVQECKICRLALKDSQGLYIVPLNFGYEEEKGNFTFYFHSALEGRKITAIENSPEVGFEMDCTHKLVEDPDACEYGFSFRSIIGTGIATFIEDPSEKIHGLKLLMKQQTGRDFDFTEKMTEEVAVIKLIVTELTGKWHK